MARYFWLIVCMISLFITGGCRSTVPKNQILSDQDFKKFLEKTPVFVIAPAFGIEKQELFELKKLIHSQHILFPNHLISKNTFLYANTDEYKYRFAILKDSLYTTDETIIWALRGGYGSALLIEALSKLSPPSKEKILIGYSDITALHLFISQKWKWKTIHGSMLKELMEPQKNSLNFKQLEKIIKGEGDTLMIKNLVPLNLVAIESTNIQGLLTGGNLTLLENSIGTVWQLEAKQKILFIEDVHLKDYQIHRSLYHLKEAKILEEVKAIIFGNFHESPQHLIALKQFATEIDIPVFKTNQFGHGFNNVPLIYLEKAEINVSENIEKQKEFSFIQNQSKVRFL